MLQTGHADTTPTADVCDPSTHVELLIVDEAERLKRATGL